MTDRNKTIEQLENSVWPHDPYPSNVVQRGQRLRKVPLNELTTDDLRFLVGQKIGLAHILPIAFELLAENPTIAGEMYPGDLLWAVASVPADFWDANAHLNDELVDLTPIIESLYRTLQDEILPLLKKRAYRP